MPAIKPNNYSKNFTIGEILADGICDLPETETAYSSCLPCRTLQMMDGGQFFALHLSSHERILRSGGNARLLRISVCIENF